MKLKKVKYLGPMDRVLVEGDPQMKGEEKEYPADVAEELIATAVRQRFEPVGWKPSGPEPAEESVEAPAEPKPEPRKTRKKKTKK